ncbi:MAG: PilN domain-containing protein [Blastocatellia bacterium]|nr:PilN domain-containing protein [Blastocatellia bacterium]
MPKINLLQQNATEKTTAKSGGVSTQTTQQIVMLVGILLAIGAVVTYDWLVTTRENERVKVELEQEKKVAKELEDLKKQGEKLQKQITLVENRIKVIKQLRAEQRGPVAVLSRINERIPIGVKLESITQRDSDMTIVGTTTTEGLITTFAQDLEFSGGLFTQFDVKTELLPATPTGEQAWKFTIRCKYNPPVAAPNQDANQQASAG